MEPTDVVGESIKSLQDSIDKLQDLVGHPGIDGKDMNAKIEALMEQQDDLRLKALTIDLNSVGNKAAIKKLLSAASDLTKAAGQIGNASTALNDAVKVVDAAASLIGALASLA